MFYCELCRVKKEWPESFARSYGRCEVCGEQRICNDRASSTLPLPPGSEKILVDMLEAEIKVLRKKITEVQRGPELCQGHIPIPEEGPKSFEMCYMPLPCKRAHLHEDTGQ